MKNYLLITAILFQVVLVSAQQNVGIGTTTPAPTSILDITSTTKGMLIPRMTYSQKIAISNPPATGLMVYQTNSGGLPVQSSGIYYYDGTTWKRFARSDEVSGGGSSGWTIAGDDQYSNLIGNVGIGTTDPTSKFHVVGNILQENGTFTINNSGGIIQFKNANVSKTYVQLSGANLRMGTNSGNTAGQFIIRMNGQERMLIDSTGYIGMGTTSPESLLHVFGGNIKVEHPGIVPVVNIPYPVRFEAEISSENNKSGGLYFGRNGIELGNAYYVNKTSYPSYFKFGISDPDALDLMIANNRRVGVNVVSGTTDLPAQLHIRGDNNVDELALSNATLGGSPTIQFYKTLSGGITKSAYMQMTSDDLRMGTNSGNSTGKFIVRMNTVDRMTLSPSGNLGIGTSNPVAKLTIEGGDDADPNPFVGNGFLMMGTVGGNNLIMDDNEIMTRNSNNSATLTLQNDGGDLKVGSNNKLLVANNGNVGIGTGSPNAKLDVNGNVKLGYTTINTGGAGQVLQLDGDSPAIGFTYGSIYSYFQQQATRFQVFSGNNLPFVIAAPQVAIGSYNSNASGYLMSVSGKIICEELKVELYNTWPDYVFADDYQMPSLHELKTFIQTNNHLPNIPKATEVAKDGFEVGEMNRKLLEKVEELTLYVIQLQEQIDEMKKGGSKF